MVAVQKVVDCLPQFARICSAGSNEVGVVKSFGSHKGTVIGIRSRTENLEVSGSFAVFPIYLQMASSRF